MARPATVATAATKFLQSTSLSAKKFAPSLSLHRHARLFSPLLAASAVQVVLTLQGLVLVRHAKKETVEPVLHARYTHAHNRQDVFLVQFLARVRLRACRIDDAKPDSRLYSLTKSWGYGLGNELMPEIMGRL
ncbi:hypothetical protein MY3296_008360 [Beauveria thailandica]